MPRIRTIKPEFFLDDDLASLPFECRLAFAGLWCHADRCGRLVDNPRMLRAQIFPYDDVDFDGILRSLATHRKLLSGRPLIIRYIADDTGYIQICNFSRHQQVHTTERQSTIPAPTDERYYDLPGRFALSANHDEPAPPAEERKAEERKGATARRNGAVKRNGKPRITFSSETGTLLNTAPYTAIWAEKYPGVDIPGELRRMEAWLQANRPRYRNYARFIVNWLNRATETQTRNASDYAAGAKIALEEGLH